MLGETLEEAGRAVFAEVEAMGGVGGVILTGPTGETAWVFNTPGMYRGTVSSSGEMRVAIFDDE
jgi:beta-aspartyl-peptidase (threonine type)